MNNEYVMVFGGGELQCSLIERASKCGYKVIVIDPNPKAPGRSKSDVFFTVAGEDYESIKNIALEFRPRGILTTATDKPILMMSKLAEELGYLFPSFKSCQTVLDKWEFKRFLVENEILHARGNIYDKNSEVYSGSFKFPVIVKPRMNSGSRGVFKCNDYEELEISIRETLLFCQDGFFLIEEYLDGDEISVEALVQGNNVSIIQITDKIVTSPPYNVEMGHIQPSKYIYLKPTITNLLQEIVWKTGLNNCALHPEFKVINNELYVIEIGPRLGGDFITSHLVPLSTGINMEEELIKIAVGEKITTGSSKDRFSSIVFFDFHKSKLDLNRLNEIHDKNSEIIVSYEIYYENLINLPKVTNSLSRHGHVIFSTDTFNALISLKNILTNEF